MCLWWAWAWSYFRNRVVVDVNNSVEISSDGLCHLMELVKIIFSIGPRYGRLVAWLCSSCIWRSAADLSVLVACLSSQALVADWWFPNPIPLGLNVQLLPSTRTLQPGSIPCGNRTWLMLTVDLWRQHIRNFSPPFLGIVCSVKQPGHPLNHHHCREGQVLFHQRWWYRHFLA